MVLPEDLHGDDNYGKQIFDFFQPGTVFSLWIVTIPPQNYLFFGFDAPDLWNPVEWFTTDYVGTTTQLSLTL